MPEKFMYLTNVKDALIFENRWHIHGKSLDVYKSPNAELYTLFWVDLPTPLIEKIPASHVSTILSDLSAMDRKLIDQIFGIKIIHED